MLTADETVNYVAPEKQTNKKAFEILAILSKQREEVEKCGDGFESRTVSSINDIHVINCKVDMTEIFKVSPKGMNRLMFESVAVLKMTIT